jgi:hypothetical protein
MPSRLKIIAAASQQGIGIQTTAAINTWHFAVEFLSFSGHISNFLRNRNENRAEQI